MRHLAYITIGKNSSATDLQIFNTPEDRDLQEVYRTLRRVFSELPQTKDWNILKIEIGTSD